MKQYLFTILAILAMPLQAKNEFRIGDVLHSQQITYKSFDKTEGQDWITVSNLSKGVYILTFYINGTPYSVKITI